MITFLALLIGLLGGCLASLCGVGGGILFVPAFIHLLGLEPKAAIATSLGIIVPTALSGTLSNLKSDLIQWPILIPTAIGAMIAAWFAADLMRSLSNAQLTRGFGIILILIGVKMIFFKST